MQHPHRSLAGLFLGALLVAAPSPSHAQSDKGVLVRLETGGASVDGAVVATLTPTQGDAIDLTLLDDGNPPDVTGGDGVYAAAALTNLDAFDVSLSLGDRTLSGGPVSWDPDQSGARDLVITLSGDSISVAASVPTAGGAPADPSVGGEAPANPAVGATPPADPAVGATAPAGGATPPTAAAPTIGSAVPAVGSTTSGQGDALLWVVLGLGLIGLALAGVLLTRKSGGSGGGVDLPRLPEPPLLGPGTPTLSDGMSVWQVPAGHRDALLAPLLATLARHHRVLAVAPSTVKLPPVFGGPVFHLPPSNAQDIDDAMQDLADSDGAPPALLMVVEGTDATAIEARAGNLPAGIGGIALVTGDVKTALPRVSLAQDGGQAVIVTSGGTIVLRPGDLGFEVAGRA